MKTTIHTTKTITRLFCAVSLIFCLGFSVKINAQTTLYSQDFGTGTSWPTGWSSYSWTVSTSNSSPTPTFSGGSNASSSSSSSTRTVYFNNNLSTVGYTNITILWAGRRAHNKTVTCQWSINGYTWNNATFSDVSNNSTWAWVNGGTRISLPAGAEGATNLRFRWRYDSDGTAGRYRIDDFSVQGIPPGPTLSVSPSDLYFGYVPSGSTSAEKTYVLSGISLDPPTGNITVTAPTGFEVSTTSGSGFGSPVTVPYSGGTLADTDIYVHFVPTGPPADYSGNISNAGGDATTVNVAVTGTSIFPACSFDNNTSVGITHTPCIDFPSNQQTVGQVDFKQYFLMNVIKGLTYIIKTCTSPGGGNGYQLSVYNESAQEYADFSDSNTGNSCGNARDVYLSFTSTFSGQVRVLFNERGNCATSINNNITIYADVTGGSNSIDNQNSSGSNLWIGHIYDGTNKTVNYDESFLNYLGYYTESESFDQGFGGNTNCFGPVISRGTQRATVYTETYSIRYRMNSSKDGLYRVNIGSDDGKRLAVDGSLVFDDWVDQGYDRDDNILINLNGASNLVLDYYEQGGGNRVSFSSPTLIFSNDLSTNLTQSICLGNSGSQISGNTFGSLPSGISRVGTGYQWTYSTSTSGPWNNISGATGATYTPDASGSPFDSPNTYYIRRNAILRSTNNVSPDPYIATNESNLATVVVNPDAAVSSVIGSTPLCVGSTDTYTATDVDLGGGTGAWSSSSDAIATVNSSGLVTAIAAGSCNIIYTITNGCNGTPSAQQPLTVIQTDGWIGSTDSDWSDPGNWCGGVPGSLTDVVISSSPTNQPHVDITSAVCDDLTVISGASLTIDAGQALTVGGNLFVDDNGTMTIQSNSLTNSGSLIVGSSTGTITYNRWMNNDDHYMYSSPVTGCNIAAFQTTNGVTVSQWDEPNGVWNSTSDVTFTPGKGYAWDKSGGSSGAVAFEGALASSSFTFPVTAPWVYTTYPDWDPSRPVWGGGGWNLLGNPYTSALNISDAGTNFITTNITDKFDPNYVAIYLYQDDGTYYTIALPTGGAPGEYIQVGQGFLILAWDNTVSFTFNSGMQSHQPSVPLRNPSQTRDPWPGLILKVVFDDKEHSTRIVYNDEMTAGLDPAYDVGFLSSGTDMEIYTRLVEDNEITFTRQALPFGDYQTNVIPVGIDSENGGEVTFSADIVQIEGRNFMLEDIQTGIFSYLLWETYTVTLPPQTYGTGRFYIHSVISTGIDEPKPGDQYDLNIRVWTADNFLNIEGELSDQAVGYIYDLMGRLILETRLSNNELNTITVPAYLNGMYLLLVRDGEKSATRKFVF